MSDSDSYDRGRAAECLERANRTENRADKLAWLQLTECWLVLDQLLTNCQVPEAPPQTLPSAQHVLEPAAG
jgi:hypothetical protein